MLDPLSLNEKEDAEWISILNDVTYFNLEVCHDYNSLVINASKQGIDAFLQEYGELRTPPGVISFSKLQRPTRRWLSPEIDINKHPEASDPTPYIINCINGHDWNYLVPQLQIEFIAKEGAQILCAGIRDGVPLLILNQQGWKTFLALLHHLRDTSYWFFVAASNPAYSGRPFFQLTTPYVGHSEDHVFKAIEFIRLEPSEEIYLNIVTNYQVFGNSAGLLLFPHCLREFAFSQADAMDFLNRWNDLPSTLLGKEDEPLDKNPSNWVHLRKIVSESPYPLISFEDEGETEKDICDFYIFGNSKGFEELADVIEEYAFASDHEDFSIRPLKRRCRGDVVEGGLGPKNFRKLVWGLIGGGLFTPKYNPSRFTGTPANLSPYDTTHELEKNFINDRIIFQ